MKNWILILALFSIHGCKVFNDVSIRKNQPAFCLEGYQSGIENLPEGSDHTLYAQFILNSAYGEEEYKFFQCASYFTFNDFRNTCLLIKDNFSYCLRNIIHKWHIPIYIISKRLII